MSAPDELARVSAERDVLQTQLDQALELLREAAPALLEGAKELRKVIARAPAQPAAPTTDALPWDAEDQLLATGQPAAPEPSADTVPESMHVELREVMLSERRAKESAEAQLAAARAALVDAVDYANGRWCEWGERAETVRDKLESVQSLLTPLTPAPTPVAAEPHWLTKDFNALYRAARELLRAIDGHWLDQRAEGARIGLSGQLTRLQPAFDETEAARAELAGRAP